MAAENAKHRTRQVVINNGLDICPYRKKKVQGFIVIQIIKRSHRCKKLLKRHVNKSVGRKTLSDEKLICSEDRFNVKNDVYSTTFKNLPKNFRNGKHFQNKNSFMLGLLCQRMEKCL